MTSGVLSILTNEALWAVPLFLAIVAIIFFILSRTFTADLFKEILRTIGLIFVAPFKYIRKTAREVSLGDNDPRLSSTDHYLSTKLLAVLRIGLIAISVLGLALVLVLSIEAFLPPAYLRAELDAERESLAKAQKTLADATAKADQEDSDWKNHRAQILKDQRDSQKQAIAANESNLSADERAVEKDATAANIFPAVKQFLNARSSYPDQAVQEAKSLIQHVPSLAEQQTSLLETYCDDWARLQHSRAPLPEDDRSLRLRAQPDHQELLETITSQKSAVEDFTTRVATTEKEVNDAYSVPRLCETLTSGLATLLVYVWLVGIGIELFSMALYLLADVKRIRENSDRSLGA